jgi:beta-N-acetylhexosaminidase
MDESEGAPEPQRPPSARSAPFGAVGRAGRRGTRRLVRMVRRRPRTALGLLSALLLVAALAPQLHLLGASPHPRTQVKPTPTATPTLAPADPHALDWIHNLHTVAETAYINDQMAHMSLDEKVGQLIMFEFLDDQITPTIAAQIKQFHVGGAILYKWNVTDAAGVRQLDRDMQAQAKIPLLIATDQEGGLVDRLAFIQGYHPSAEEMGARNDPNYVRQRGAEDGRELASLGINMNLAPVVDVQNIPDGQSVMGSRMFGWTPDKVTSMAGAYLNGLQQDHQVVGALKHFPGLGSVPGDPHQGVVTLNRSVADMQKIDWAPYRALFAMGQVQCVMTTHLDVPAIDPGIPTTLSYKVTTGALRDTLGFQGVIITDGIYMKALGSRYSFEQIILGSILAGNDLIASTYSYASTEQAFNILKAAVADGRVSGERLDASVRRILFLKLHMGLLTSGAKAP